MGDQCGDGGLVVILDDLDDHGGLDDLDDLSGQDGLIGLVYLGDLDD